MNFFENRRALSFSKDLHTISSWVLLNQTEYNVKLTFFPRH